MKNIVFRISKSVAEPYYTILYGELSEMELVHGMISSAELPQNWYELPFRFSSEKSALRAARGISEVLRKEKFNILILEDNYET
jgi:hypothetical protein